MIASLHPPTQALASIQTAARRFLHLPLQVLALTAASFSFAADYELETVAENLDQPWSVAFLPDGGFLLALRGGSLVKLSADGLERTFIENTPATRFAGQGGYFDVILDRDFSNNKRLFLSLAESNTDGNGTGVVAATLKDNSLRDVTHIYRNKDRISTSAHYGGRMIQLPDQRILLTTGDGFNYREDSQNIDSHLGKIIELTPSADDGSYLAKVFAYGFRNPQGLIYDESEGAIYMHEHGPKGGDELNIVEASKNYGWPATSYGVNYSGARVSPYTSLPGIEEPLKYWTPSIAPSGLTRYDGELFPDWKGSFFIGTLVYRDVRRVTLTADGSQEEILFASMEERIRDIRTAPDGHLYILTDGEQGKLIRVAPKS